MLVAAAIAEEAGPRTSLSVWVRPESADLAAMLACKIGTISVALGLCRPAMFVRRRRLLTDAAAVTLRASPVTLVGRVFARAVRRKLFVRTVLVSGRRMRADRLAGVIDRQRGRLFEWAGQLDPAVTALGPVGQQKLWGLVIAAGHKERLLVEQWLACQLSGVQVQEDVSFWERHLGRIDLANTDPNWLVFADGFSSGPFADAVRRGLDIAISLLVLIFTLPLTLLAALAIKCDTAGPVFYRQERVGLHGRVFTLMKFRSMRIDAEAGGTPRWAARNDPRVTRVGAVIRSTRIDELPQLLNVLRGEMSFIGPRPERPLFVEELARVIPLYRDRTWVKPGITGWAQVNFPYGASVEDAREKLSYDLYYVKNRSLPLDLLILISTIRVILFREGAR